MNQDKRLKWREYRLAHLEQCRLYWRNYYYRNKKKNTVRHRDYYHTPEGKAAIQRANKNYETKHPERRKTWAKMAEMRLERKPCENCGKLRSRMHKHHPDPLKPLQFTWLCPACHVKADRKIKPHD